MKKFYATMLLALVSLTVFAQEPNDTTYVILDFNANPWNYPLTEVTSGRTPNFKDWDSPGALLVDKDFSIAIKDGATEKIKVTLTAVDLDEYTKVSVYASVTTANEAEAAALGVPHGKINVLYTQNGSTLRFEAPEGYKFGKMVFHNYDGNFMPGDDYDEEFEYVYKENTFKHKLKVWKPTSPKKNQWDYDIWDGDEKNILFKYVYMSGDFVWTDIRLVPDGSAGINTLRTDGKDAEKTYTLDGREVNKANGLPKGLYIKDGKKVIVK